MIFAVPIIATQSSTINSLGGTKLLCGRRREREGRGGRERRAGEQSGRKGSRGSSGRERETAEDRLNESGRERVRDKAGKSGSLLKIKRESRAGVKAGEAGGRVKTGE